MTSVLVTSVPMRPWRPVRGIVSPFSAGGCGCCRASRRARSARPASPFFRSIAVMRPYGGLMSGRPCTVSRHRRRLRVVRVRRLAADVAPCPIASRARHEAEGRDLRCSRRCRSMPVSGSNEPPCQLAPPVAFGSISVASGPSHLLTTGGVKIGPSLKRDTSLSRFGAQLRREVDQVVDRHALPLEGRRLHDEALRRAASSRPARPTARPAAPRSARSARRSRGRTRRPTPASSAARRSCAAVRRSSRRRGSARTADPSPRCRA